MVLNLQALVKLQDNKSLLHNFNELNIIILNYYLSENLLSQTPLRVGDKDPLSEHWWR